MMLVEMRLYVSGKIGAYRVVLWAKHPRGS